MTIGLNKLTTLQPLKMKQLELQFMTNNPNRYSDDDLQMFKGIIENKLSRALELLEEHKEVMREAGEQFKPDDAPEYSNKQEATILAHKQEIFITSLRSALLRIEAKTYGICIKTGELIDRNRLMAVPNTSTGLLIKQQIKQEEEATKPEEETEL